ncbi:MAG: PfkB family carbohydrate kinase [Caulobacterales bacterium]|nr:PfkB family carbohydrate kinase [Caulobacterales bacterium]
MSTVLCAGHAVEDHVFQVPALPTTAAKHQARGFAVVGGGPAANAAVAISRLGGEARLAARVGEDAVGRSIVRDLETEGVDCSLVRAFTGARSSLSAVMVDADGQRMIVNYLDPDLPADPAWLIGGFPERVDAVLADTRWPTGAAAALARARERGVPGVLDADHPVPREDRLLAAASHIAFSADGLARFLGDDDLKAGVARMAEETGVWCCVTDGAHGVYIAARGAVDHVPAPSVHAVDTLGAGDVWHGAFALALAEGREERAAVRFANAAAAIKCTRAGGRDGAPSLAEVRAFMTAETETETSR